MTIKTTYMRLENLGDAVAWLSQEGGQAEFANNTIVIKCKGFADSCNLDIIKHDPAQALYIAIQRVYSKVRDANLPDTSRTGKKGAQINVTGRANRPNFVVRPPKPPA